MTSIELNRGFSHLNGREIVDTKNQHVQQNQQIGKEIHYLRFKRYSNSDFFLATLEPSVEKYMRENLFLASHEQKNPVNDRAEEFYQTRTDLRVNSLIKRITDAQKEFVLRGKNLLKFFASVDKELFTFMNNSTLKFGKEKQRPFMVNYEQIKKFSNQFLLFHSGKFFNDFEDHTSFGNYYIRYSHGAYIELEKFIVNFASFLKDDLFENKEQIEERHVY